MALMFGGMMIALPLAFGLAYERPLLLQVGAVLLGMLGPPFLWVLFQARWGSNLDIDEYLRFENMHAPLLADRSVQFSKRLIALLLTIGLVCAATLVVET